MVLSLVFLPFVAQTAMLDFVLAPSHAAEAYVKYEGGSNPLMADGIAVQEVFLKNDAGDRIATLDLKGAGAILTFTTGANTYSSATQWNFDGGASSSIYITITNALDLGSFGVIAAGTKILTGTDVAGEVSRIPSPRIKDPGVALLVFSDTKDETLLSYFGMPYGAYEGNVNLGFQIFDASLNPETFSFYVSKDTIGSGDVENTPVPIPGAAWLLGAGLIGLVGIRRRMLP